MPDRVIILPEDGKQVLLHALRSARKSILLSVFRLSDPDLLEELKGACRRGVAVQVLLSPHAKGWDRKLRNLTLVLRAIGAQARRYPERARKYHAKYLIIDGKTAYVMSFNFTKKCLSQTYDFGLATGDAAVARSLTKLFQVDWSRGTRLEGTLHRRLIVSPINARKRLGALIEAAERSLRIIDHRIADVGLIGLLAERAKAGVKVEVLGRLSPPPADGTPIDVRGFNGGRPHGKLMVIDDRVAVVGSIALRTISLERRRELSLTTADRECVDRLARFFKRTFHAAPSDAPPRQRRPAS